jgi:endogenous inhibitor of DNA gyrase (YacG/DUF329 family)
MREIEIHCPACACRVTVEYAGRGRPPVYCSDRCRRTARRWQQRDDSAAHGAERGRRWRAAHPEWVAGRRAWRAEDRRRQQQLWDRIAGRSTPQD